MRHILKPLLALAPITTMAAQHPNIIYIMTDQQTASAMSCIGNTDLHTPNIDRLAAAGVTFTNAYCSSPLSGPSRASMFTGYMAHELGVERNGTPIPDSVRTRTLGTLVGEAGYECAYAGKWHAHTASIPDGEFGFRNIHNHDDAGLAEVCVDFLNSHSKPERPFFLVASFDNPHNICEFARQQDLPFADITVPDVSECPGLPANYAISPYDADILQREKSLNYSAYPTTSYTDDDWRRYRYAYYRLVEHVDKEIGKIVDAIDKNSLWRNTVVIFTSDHGDGTGAHHWNQKSALYDEVTNIPLIVVLPGKKNAGKQLPQLINNGPDFFASICDWAGATKPEGTRGVSFRTIAESGNANAQHQPYVVTETMFDKGSGALGWSLRTPDFKYVLYDKGRYREQLYDMRRDRGETRNLAVEKAYAETLAQHRRMLEEWMNNYNVKSSRADVPYVPRQK